MFVTLTSILVISTLLFGGAGATVYAAQGSLPGQPLYEVKTLSEDLRLDLASGPQAQFALELAFANRRMAEIRALLQKGETIPEGVMARYGQQLDEILETAAGLGDQELALALERVRQQLRAHEQAMQNLPEAASPQALATREHLRQMIRTRLELVESGLHDPQLFRQQLREGAPGNPQGQPGQAAGNGAGPGPNASGTPGAGEGNQYGPGPQATQEPGKKSSYGPGPNASDTPGAGEGNSYGPGPQASQEPGGYGPGPQAGEEPDGGSYGPGPNPEPGSSSGPGDGSGGPGPNDSRPPEGGDGSCDGCGEGPGPGPAPDSTCTPEAGPGPEAGAGHGSGSGHGGKP